VANSNRPQEIAPNATAAMNTYFNIAFLLDGLSRKYLCFH